MKGRLVMDCTERLRKFIERAKKVHCGENLDYSEVSYVNNKTPVTIIDHDLRPDGSEYGAYRQTPSNHLKGQGHPDKRGLKISKRKREKIENLIKRFKVVHPDENLDYSQVKYVNMHTKVMIIDHDLRPDGLEYGEYWQEPAVHLKGSSHPDKKKPDNKLTQEEWIERAEKVHNSRYDYSKTIYDGYKSEVEIICSKHGSFYQTVENHLAGKGCPKCGNHSSRFEEDIKKELGVNFIEHDRDVLDGLEIDLYDPERKVGIEFNGLKWHTEWFAGRGRDYHIKKTEGCLEKGVGLIQIFEDEYYNHKDIVLSKLRHILKMEDNKPHIFARKCQIMEISYKVAGAFLEKNHIQGGTKATIYLGAYYGGLLVGVMTFKKDGKDMWDLNRFATDISFVCCGVGGKLFKYFVKQYKPHEIKSFADRRWTIDYTSNLYTKLGFKLDSFLKPNYQYYNPQFTTPMRLHKFNYRKKHIMRKYGKSFNFNDSMTEQQMMKIIGYDRIWDCGLIKYVWTNGG